MNSETGEGQRVSVMLMIFKQVVTTSKSQGRGEGLERTGRKREGERNRERRIERAIDREKEWEREG